MFMAGMIWDFRYVYGRDIRLLYMFDYILNVVMELLG